MIGGAPINPSSYGDTIAPTFTDVSGKIVSDPRLISGERTAVILVLGQSNAGNYAGAPLYTPVHASKIDNLNIADGGTYRGADPALGATWNLASWMFRFADLVIGAGIKDRFIIVPIAVGGTSVTEWVVGGDVNNRMSAAAARCSNVGLAITEVLWQQGESDLAMSQTVYQTNLLSVIASSRASGITGKWLIGKSTYNGGVTSAPVRAACAAVVNGTDIFAGADTDTLTSAYRDANLHFNEAGINAAASLWKDAYASLP